MEEDVAVDFLNHGSRDLLGALVLLLAACRGEAGREIRQGPWAGRRVRAPRADYAAAPLASGWHELGTKGLPTLGNVEGGEPARGSLLGDFGAYLRRALSSELKTGTAHHPCPTQELLLGCPLHRRPADVGREAQEQREGDRRYFRRNPARPEASRAARRSPRANSKLLRCCEFRARKAMVGTATLIQIGRRHTKGLAAERSQQPRKFAHPFSLPDQPVDFLVRQLLGNVARVVVRVGVHRAAPGEAKLKYVSNRPRTEDGGAPI